MTERVDVVVIGAGIHGAGVAQCAGARGYRVRVLERSGVAAGTSSRSSKLIHGGLRYLESYQWALVRAALRERALLLQLAPELVRLVPFHIPVYRATRRRPLTIYAGLALYAALGNFTRAARFTRVPRRVWAGLDGLSTLGLEAVFRYFDAQTDDAALTHAVLRSAQQFDVALQCPAEFIAAEALTAGYRVRYRADGREHELETATLVNAGGPWAPAVAARIAPPTTVTARALPAVELVQGTHLVVAGTLTAGCYYLEAVDGRAVFALPWRGATLVGTTETAYSGDPGAVAPHAAEREYLRATLRHYFPGHSAEITGEFAGLRVLPRTGASAFARPRETQISVETPRLVHVFGGKLTTYRHTAVAVMDRLGAALPARKAYSDTAHLRLRPA